MPDQARPDLPEPHSRSTRPIDRRIVHCESINRRFTWARLAVFLAGAALTLVAVAFYGALAGWGAFFLALVVFSVVALLQRRVDRWNAGFQIWRDLQSEQAARRALDWVHIPAPAAVFSAPSGLALDLDLTGPRSLQHLLDRAVSLQGSRRLAGWLSTAVPDVEEISARQAVVGELKGLPRFCSRLLLTFRLLKRQPFDADRLLGWLSTPLPEARLCRLLPWATLLAFGNLALFALFAAGLLPPFWLLSSAAYLAFYLLSQGLVGGFLSAVFRLDGELDTFRPLLHFIENYPFGRAAHLAALCAPFTRPQARPSRLLRQVKTAAALVGLRMNPALGLLLNIIMPWDFWAAWLAGRQKKLMARLLPAWLEAFHDLEALISLGMFAAQNPHYAFPKIGFNPLPAGSTPREDSQSVLFTVCQMGHPLLPPSRRVCNDFTCHALGELNLITGSNMAGKSTFIRTVGVNLCLAYAGGPVCASALQSGPLRLYTCIRLSDSLGDGFSYFYAEVKRLKGLLDAIRPALLPGKGSGPAQRTLTEMPLLYLIDEIFRGTNNRERLIGSRAYIKALLEAPTLGFLATHDLELAKLAETYPQVRNFHFRDEVGGGTLTFDYLIRPGPSPTTNALKIMALEGLPVDGE